MPRAWLAAYLCVMSCLHDPSPTHHAMHACLCPIMQASPGPKHASDPLSVARPRPFARPRPRWLRLTLALARILTTQVLQDRADFTSQAKLLSQHFTLSHHRNTALQVAHEALQVEGAKGE